MDKILCCKAKTDYEGSYTVSIQSHVGFTFGSMLLRNHWQPLLLNAIVSLTDSLHTGNMKKLRRALYLN